VSNFGLSGLLVAKFTRGLGGVAEMIEGINDEGEKVLVMT
jgi:hypothetical protein